MTKRVLMIFMSMLLVVACTDSNVKPAADKIPDAELQKMEDEYNASVENSHDEVVCRKEAVIGSRFKEVRCRTKAQASQDSEEARRFMDKRKSIPTNE